MSRRRGDGADSLLVLWIVATGPLLIALICLPLMLGAIEPNPLYGVRTAASLASEEAWYRANRAGGVAGVGAGLFGFAANVLVLRSQAPSRRKIAICIAILLVVTLIMTAAGLGAA